MQSKSVKHSGASAADLVDTLLEDIDPKLFALRRVPKLIDQALSSLEKRFYHEFKTKKFVGADHADDRAIELAGEIADEFHIDADGEDFDQLLQKCFNLARIVRPLL
jgi:hypothetical protein